MRSALTVEDENKRAVPLTHIEFRPSEGGCAIQQAKAELVHRCCAVKSDNSASGELLNFADSDDEGMGADRKRGGAAARTPESMGICQPGNDPFVVVVSGLVVGSDKVFVIDGGTVPYFDSSASSC